MPVVTRRELLEAGVHFGHQTRRWNPKMSRFLYGERSGIYIIDLEKSLQGLEETYAFVRDLGRRDGIVLFIGTKKQAQEVVATHATSVGMPFVNNRWLGGMLTNFTTISKRLGRMRELREMERTGALDYLPKKEAIRLRREREKLERNLSGIQDLERVPDAVFIIDTKKEHIAVTEARKLGIPVIAIVDTNCDPDEVDFVIPGNDDAIRSVTLVARVIADALREGRGMAKDDLVEQMTAEAVEGRRAGDRDAGGGGRDRRDHGVRARPDARRRAGRGRVHRGRGDPRPKSWPSPSPRWSTAEPEVVAEPAERRMPTRRGAGMSDDHRRAGQGAPGCDRCRDDGLQERAGGDRRRLRACRGPPQGEGPGAGREARRPLRRSGADRQLHPFQQHRGCARRGELRDRLRREHRRVPAAGEGHRAAHREPGVASIPRSRGIPGGRARTRATHLRGAGRRRPASPNR